MVAGVIEKRWRYGVSLGKVMTVVDFIAVGKQYLY